MEAREFYGEFNSQRDEIERSIDDISKPEEKMACLEEISNLSDLCKSNLHILPHYDQKLYTEQIQKLIEKAESKSAKAKPKFLFKKKPPVSHNIAKTRQPAPTAAETAPIPTYSNLDSWYCSDKEDTEISNLYILKAQNSIINLQNAYSTVRLDEIKDCIILINNIEGPVYLTEIQNSRVFIKCHQFRMHSSSNDQIALTCQSKRPIIETCTNLSFSQLDPDNEWENVDDFDWLKSTPSENWKKGKADLDLYKKILKMAGPSGKLTSSQIELIC